MRINTDGKYVTEILIPDQENGKLLVKKIERKYWDAKEKRSELLEAFMRTNFSSLDNCKKFVEQYGMFVPTSNESIIDEECVVSMQELAEFIKRMTRVLNRANMNVYRKQRNEILELKDNVDEVTIFLEIMNLLVGSDILELLQIPEQTNYGENTPVLKFLMDFLKQWRGNIFNPENELSQDNKLGVRNAIFRRNFVSTFNFKKMNLNEKSLKKNFCDEENKEESRESAWSKFYKWFTWNDGDFYKLEEDKNGYSIFVIENGAKDILNEKYQMNARNGMEKLARYIMEEYCTFICDCMQCKMEFNANGEMMWGPVNITPIQALMLALVYTYDSKTFLRTCGYCKKFFFPPSTHPQARCCSSKCADRLNKKIKRRSGKH